MSYNALPMRMKRHALSLREGCGGLVLFCLCIPVLGQQVPTAPPPEDELSPPLIFANICPKFILIGVPRRVKFYGAAMTGVQIRYEEEDLLFSGYEVDLDELAFTVIIEATDKAEVGKHVLTLVKGEEETGPEAILYVLRREDRALLQRDLVRCPWMKDQYITADKKAPPPSPAHP